PKRRFVAMPQYFRSWGTSASPAPPRRPDRRRRRCWRSPSCRSPRRPCAAVAPRLAFLLAAPAPILASRIDWHPTNVHLRFLQLLRAEARRVAGGGRGPARGGGRTSRARGRTVA